MTKILLSDGPQFVELADTGTGAKLTVSVQREATQVIYLDLAALQLLSKLFDTLDALASSPK